MLKTVWLLLLVLSLLLFTLAVILIFVWDIPNLVDEMSGRKAKRQIQKLKELNAQTGSLEGMSTDDLYHTMSSGTLLSEEITKLKPEIQEDQVEEVQIDKLPEEEEISYTKPGEATKVTSAVQEYCKRKKVITILEEQSSLITEVDR